jgi:hypothetical protein
MGLVVGRMGRIQAPSASMPAVHTPPCILVTAKMTKSFAKLTASFPFQRAGRLGASVLQVLDLYPGLKASQIFRHKPTMAPVGLWLGAE